MAARDQESRAAFEKFFNSPAVQAMPGWTLRTTDVQHLVEFYNLASEVDHSKAAEAVIEFVNRLLAYPNVATSHLSSAQVLRGHLLDALKMETGVVEWYGGRNAALDAVIKRKLTDRYEKEAAGLDRKIAGNMADRVIRLAGLKWQAKSRFGAGLGLKAKRPDQFSFQQLVDQQRPAPSLGPADQLRPFIRAAHKCTFLLVCGASLEDQVEHDKRTRNPQAAGAVQVPDMAPNARARRTIERLEASGITARHLHKLGLNSSSSQNLPELIDKWVDRGVHDYGTLRHAVRVSNESIPNLFHRVTKGPRHFTRREAFWSSLRGALRIGVQPVSVAASGASRAGQALRSTATTNDLHKAMQGSDRYQAEISVFRFFEFLIGQERRDTLGERFSDSDAFIAHCIDAASSRSGDAVLDVRVQTAVAKLGELAKDQANHGAMALLALLALQPTGLRAPEYQTVTNNQKVDGERALLTRTQQAEVLLKNWGLSEDQARDAITHTATSLNAEKSAAFKQADAVFGRNAVQHPSDNTYEYGAKLTNAERITLRCAIKTLAENGRLQIGVTDKGSIYLEANPVAALSAGATYAFQGVLNVGPYLGVNVGASATNSLTVEAWRADLNIIFSRELGLNLRVGAGGKAVFRPSKKVVRGWNAPGLFLKVIGRAELSGEVARTKATGAAFSFKENSKPQAADFLDTVASSRPITGADLVEKWPIEAIHEARETNINVTFAAYAHASSAAGGYVPGLGGGGVQAGMAFKRSAKFGWRWRDLRSGVPDIRRQRNRTNQQQWNIGADAYSATPAAAAINHAEHAGGLNRAQDGRVVLPEASIQDRQAGAAVKKDRTTKSFATMRQLPVLGELPKESSARMILRSTLPSNDPTRVLSNLALPSLVDLLNEGNVRSRVDAAIRRMAPGSACAVTYFIKDEARLKVNALRAAADRAELVGEVSKARTFRRRAREILNDVRSYSPNKLSAETTTILDRRPAAVGPALVSGQLGSTFAGGTRADYIVDLTKKDEPLPAHALARIVQARPRPAASSTQPPIAPPAPPAPTTQSVAASTVATSIDFAAQISNAVVRRTQRQNQTPAAQQQAPVPSPAINAPPQPMPPPSRTMPSAAPPASPAQPQQPDTRRAGVPRLAIPPGDLTPASNSPQESNRSDVSLSFAHVPSDPPPTDRSTARGNPSQRGIVPPRTHRPAPSRDGMAVIASGTRVAARPSVRAGFVRSGAPATPSSSTPSNRVPVIRSAKGPTIPGAAEHQARMKRARALAPSTEGINRTFASARSIQPSATARAGVPASAPRRAAPLPASARAAAPTPQPTPRVILSDEPSSPRHSS